jgi:hypothetical protein
LSAGYGGGIVAVVGTVPDTELAALARLRGQFGAVTTVHFHRSCWDSDVESVPGGLIAPGTIRVSRERPFREAWNGTFQRNARSARVLERLP